MYPALLLNLFVELPFNVDNLVGYNVRGLVPIDVVVFFMSGVSETRFSYPARNNIFFDRISNVCILQLLWNVIH